MKKKAILFSTILCLILFPFFSNRFGNVYLVHILALIGIYIILSLGLNLTIGLTGLLDLGFCAFYAIGAYSSVLLNLSGVSFWFCVPLSIGISVLFRFLLGKPVLHLRGDYLAIVTLGFGEITRLALNNWDSLTNGPKGLPKVGEIISPPKISSFVFRDDIHFYYLILFFVLVVVIISYRLENSRIGRALVAIREDETAASAMGIDISNLKMIAFLFSGGIAGLAGCLYSHWIGFISPESFTFWESVFLVCMVVLGGIGSIPGVILGVFLLVGVPEVLRIFLGQAFVSYRMLVFGFAMIVMVILRPEGIIPSIRRFYELRVKNDIRDKKY
ncbi:MAG: branched-chain amino acid ABC transporter permease [bacterium]